MYEGWTTRELVHLLLLAASQSKHLNVEPLLAQLRASILEHELGTKGAVEKQP